MRRRRPEVRLRARVLSPKLRPPGPFLRISSRAIWPGPALGSGPGPPGSCWTLGLAALRWPYLFGLAHLFGCWLPTSWVWPCTWLDGNGL